MTTQELNQLSDKLWSAINTAKTQDLSRENQISILRSILTREIEDIEKRVRNRTINDCVEEIQCLRV